MMLPWLKKVFACTLLLFVLVVPGWGQERDNKVIRPFNTGVSWGMGGAHVVFFPSVDVSYKPFTARVSPGFTATTVGLSTEIKRLHEVFNISPIYDSWYIIGSAYYSTQSEDGQWPVLDYSSFDLVNKRRYIFVTGLKVVSGERLYSRLQVGAMMERSEKILTEEWETNYLPHIEFSLGLHLFKNYKTKEESE